ALSAFRALRRPVGEAPLRRRDAPALAGIVVGGAVVGPVLLVLGLQRLPGSAGALLLNLEAPFTALLAVLMFGEHLGLRGGQALASVAAGACARAFAAGGLHVDPAGAALVAMACAPWASPSRWSGSRDCAAAPAPWRSQRSGGRGLPRRRKSGRRSSSERSVRPRASSGTCAPCGNSGRRASRRSSPPLPSSALSSRGRYWVKLRARA